MASNDPYPLASFQVAMGAYQGAAATCFKSRRASPCHRSAARSGSRVVPSPQRPIDHQPAPGLTVQPAATVADGASGGAEVGTGTMVTTRTTTSVSATM